ncbi:MAG: PqiC family protein [Gammaproteobacteria bacterium]
MSTARALCRTVAVAALCIQLATTGCARQPAPALYLLDLPPAPATAPIEARATAVGIGPIELPPYLDRPQIVVRDDVHTLSAPQAHMWAEPIADGVARVLLASVARALGSDHVYHVPRRTPTPLDWRVAIDITRLDGTPGGSVTLDARWELFSGDARQAMATHVSRIAQGVAGDDHAALVAAQAAALDRLGAEIAAVLGMRTD